MTRIHNQDGTITTMTRAIRVDADATTSADGVIQGQAGTAAAPAPVEGRTARSNRARVDVQGR